MDQLPRELFLEEPTTNYFNSNCLLQNGVPQANATNIVILEFDNRFGWAIVDVAARTPIRPLDVVSRVQGPLLVPPH